MAKLIALRDRLSEGVIGAAIVAEQYRERDPEASGRACVSLHQVELAAREMVAMAELAKRRF